ncbi:MAG: hypothetical protein AB3X44_09730 [Leptothrix sp. (in: b-proteobacteria)]
MKRVLNILLMILVFAIPFASEAYLKKTNRGGDTVQRDEGGVYLLDNFKPYLPKDLKGAGGFSCDARGQRSSREAYCFKATSHETGLTYLVRSDPGVAAAIFVIGQNTTTLYVQFVGGQGEDLHRAKEVSSQAMRYATTHGYTFDESRRTMVANGGVSQGKSGVATGGGVPQQQDCSQGTFMQKMQCIANNAAKIQPVKP